MAVLIIVQLYTVPIVLDSLGIEDYGIYNVVGGFVVMFGFVCNSLTSGIQRFFAFAIGKQDVKMQKEILASSMSVFMVLVIVLFGILEFVGVWFLNTHMNIPEDRILTANWVLQFSILSLIVTIICIPFNSMIIAHERLSAYAYASIFDGLYKLAIAMVLVWVLYDKLIVYSGLMLSSALLVSAFYFVYCRKHFPEAEKLCFCWRTAIIKDMASYAGWNIIGTLAYTLRNHGVNIIMNIFFTPVLNAAHTISTHISGFFNQFVHNVYMATRPQMVKQYAAGNMDEMWKITLRSSKYAFFLMAYIAVPILIEMPSCLGLWLHDVPAYTVEFSRLMILSLMLETMTNQIIGVFQAANKIKYYQSVSSIVQLAVVPLAFIALKQERNPLFPYIIYCVISAIYAVSLLVIAHRQLGLNVKDYVLKVMGRDLLVFVPALIITMFVVVPFEQDFFRILITSCVSFCLITSIIWIWGMDSEEKTMVFSLIKNKVNKK